MRVRDKGSGFRRGFWYDVRTAGTDYELLWHDRLRMSANGTQGCTSSQPSAGQEQPER
jgi:hypothetical protein